MVFNSSAPPHLVVFISCAQRPLGSVVGFVCLGIGKPNAISMEAPCACPKRHFFHNVLFDRPAFGLLPNFAMVSQRLHLGPASKFKGIGIRAGVERNQMYAASQTVHSSPFPPA